MKIQSNKKESKINNIIAVLAIVVVAVALFNFVTTIIKISDFNEQITGFASGYVNLTINTLITINISRNTQWGGGMVNTTEGATNASLTTIQESASVIRGNWTAGAKAIVIQNLGNVNASLFITAGKDAAGFFGGTPGDQSYKWNITNKEAGSCLNATDVGGWNRWADVNITTGGTKFCSQFGYVAGQNEVYLDTQLVVPYDAKNTSVQTDTITITGNTAG